MNANQYKSEQASVVIRHGDAASSGGNGARKHAERTLFQSIRVHAWAFVVSLVAPVIAATYPTGPIIIDPDHPHSFRYQSGERFFPLGDTAYYLIAQPNNVIAHYIDVRRAHQFNFIRVMATADGFWPFGGTPDRPQYTVINETALQKWDWVFDYAAARGMNIELILWGYGVGGGEGLWASPSNQELWIDTLVNRLRGRPNRPPQVVWPLWEASAVNLNVTQNNEGVQPRTWGNFDGPRRGLTYYPTNWQGVDYPARSTATGWEFEAAGMEDCLEEDWAHGKPVLNTEFGYQHEAGYESEMNHATRQCHQPATVRKKAWKIATAGAYFAAGFEGTAVRRFTEGDVDNFRPQQLEVLYDFFTGKTEYWKMAPHLELVASHNVLLALPGREYVAYFPRGGTNYIELVSGAYEAEWLHAATGRHYRQPDLTVAAGRREFVPPEQPNDDWVFHLRQRNGP
ncbi:MAG: DUF4038 domain-containing protein [Planctomycetes bacterium]|nr:DUF4038 domain-containing protein [Planctomycetota bacterium]